MKDRQIKNWKVSTTGLKIKICWDIFQHKNTCDFSFLTALESNSNVLPFLSQSLNTSTLISSCSSCGKGLFDKEKYVYILYQKREVLTLKGLPCLKMLLEYYHQQSLFIYFWQCGNRPFSQVLHSTQHWHNAK